MHSAHTPFYDPWIDDSRVETLASAPASPVHGQMYIKSGDSHLYWYNKSTGWVDGGHVDDIDFYYDTFYIRKAGYAKPYPPFEQPGVPIPSGELGHLRCMDVTCGDLNPIADATYGCGGASNAWLGVCAHTLYADALKKLNGDTWDLGAKWNVYY